jgi:hypothetical protein
MRASTPFIFITILPPFLSGILSLSEKNCTFCRGRVIYNELVVRQNKQQESNDSEEGEVCTGMLMVSVLERDMI